MYVVKITHADGTVETRGGYCYEAACLLRDAYEGDPDVTVEVIEPDFDPAGQR